MALLPPDDLGLPAPPDESVTVLDGFEAALDELPRKRRDNLLIGTWNIRHFGRVQPAWESKPRVSPKRNLQDMCAIAQVVVQIAPSIRDAAGRLLHPLAVGGLLAGLALMYGTGLLISL